MSILDDARKGITSVSAGEHSRYMAEQSPTHGGYITITLALTGEVVGIQVFDFAKSAPFVHPEYWIPEAAARRLRAPKQG